MRRTLSFTCAGETLWATLDAAAGETGLLIVSGGNEIRVGAHRGMARLAADVAAAGHPVFRFDRRGIGDSSGANAEFEGSADDLSAAISAFRAETPALRRIVAFGNCDAASALLIHAPAGLSGLVLSNIWVIEPQDDAMPPPAAIKAHYWARMRDPKAWLSLFKGAVDLRKLVEGLTKVARTESCPSGLAQRVAEGLMRFSGPVRILLASGDGAAITFADAWKGHAFDPARSRNDIQVQKIDTASHSFADEADYAALKTAILEMLRT